jgi:hypothetical protein
MEREDEGQRAVETGCRGGQGSARAVAGRQFVPCLHIPLHSTVISTYPLNSLSRWLVNTSGRPQNKSSFSNNSCIVINVCLPRR